jgi:hypothetical protein
MNQVRSRNATSNASPMGSAVAIVIGFIAALLGFFILRNIRQDDGGSSVSTPTPTIEVSVPPVVSDPVVAPVVTDPPAPAIVVIGASVQVANFSGSDGAAGAMSDLLAAEGFTMAAGTSKAGDQSKLTATVVAYDPSMAGAQAVAESVALLLGGVAVEQITGLPIPTETGEWPDQATRVLVKLGTDLGGDLSLPGKAPSSDTPTTPTEPALPATETTPTT